MMTSSKNSLHDNEWLQQHLQGTSDYSYIQETHEQQQQLTTKELTKKSNMGRTTNNTASTRIVTSPSPGRTRHVPIVVAGEDTTPPLIIVESRDISPDLRTQLRHQSPPPHYTASKIHNNNNNIDDDDAKNRDEQQQQEKHRNRSRTLSPIPRADRKSTTISKKDERQLDSIIENLQSTKRIDTHSSTPPTIQKAATKESMAGTNSDAITTPHTNTNRRKSRNTTVTTTSTTRNISPTSEHIEEVEEIDEDVLQNMISMTSSITSNATDDDADSYYYTEQHAVPKTTTNVRPQHNTTSNIHSSQQQDVRKTKNLVPQPGSNNHRTGSRIQPPPQQNDSKNKRNDEIDRKAEQKRREQISKKDASIIGDYPSTPIRRGTEASTPKNLYDAFDVGSTSYSPFNNLISPLSVHLSDVLRNSSSETGSFFHDFQNPNDAKQQPKKISKVTPTDRGTSKMPRSRLEKASLTVSPEQVSPSRNQHPTVHSLVDKDQFASEYSTTSNRSDVISHSILQLCTEDLMSDDASLVNAALCRLYDVCCIVSEKSIKNSSEKETASIISTSSASSTVLNRIRFLKAGGHALIVGVMKKYCSDATIQASSCRLIHQLILMDEYQIESNSDNINGIGSSKQNGGAGAFNELFSAVYGMDCVVAVLHRFRPSNVPDQSDDEVYNLACGALVAIVCSSSKMIDRLLQHDTRYVSIFLKAMHAPINKSNAGINRVIYYILKQFPQYVNEIVSADGIEEIIHEMKKFPDSIEVQYCGCSALGTLLQKNSRMIMSLSSKDAHKFGNGSIVEYIVNQLDGAHLIVKAMKTFSSIEDVQGKGVVALCNITTSAASTKSSTSITSSIKKAGGLSAIGIALENFPNNQTIQDKGCLAIKTLLENSAMIFPNE